MRRLYGKDLATRWEKLRKVQNVQECDATAAKLWLLMPGT